MAQEEAHAVVHGIVPLSAGCAYLAIATNQGSVVVCEGAGMRTSYSARYIDWSFKLQPLLGLAMTAMHGRMRRGATATP